MPPEAGAARALPVAVTFMDQARARKRDAVLTIIGLQNAGIGTVILIGDHEYVCEDRGARRVREYPAAPVNLAREMCAIGLMEPGN